MQLRDKSDVDDKAVEPSSLLLSGAYSDISSHSESNQGGHEDAGMESERCDPKLNRLTR